MHGSSTHDYGFCAINFHTFPSDQYGLRNDLFVDNLHFTPESDRDSHDLPFSIHSTMRAMNLGRVSVTKTNPSHWMMLENWFHMKPIKRAE